MRDRAHRSGSPRRKVSADDIAFYVLTIGAVVLAWQIAIQPLVQRAPAEVAIRLGPSSPSVLGRAAETELIAGRHSNAASLSRDALARAPFDVRALRVLGLAEARSGREDRADELLTLAGNWSLRDDPAHAWLVERRLRQGDYGSAFAHADTLVRRRPDIRPQVFQLFTLAAGEDPQRSLPVLADLLAADPPWRRAYFNSLDERPEHLLIQMNLAIMLQSSRAPLSNPELQHLYYALLDKGLIEALRTVRQRLGRPPADLTLVNGDFADASAPRPFQWILAQRGGVASEIIADDVRSDDRALRVEYDGFSSVRIARQLTLLAPGLYRLSGEVRIEDGDPERLMWTVRCAVGSPAGVSIGVTPGRSAAGAWTPFSSRLEIPPDCPAQWLALEARGGDRRSPSVVWFDRMAISRGE